MSFQFSSCSPVPSLIFVFGVCTDTMWSSRNHITENVPFIDRLAVKERFSTWGHQAVLSLLSNASPATLHAATAKWSWVVHWSISSVILWLCWWACLLRRVLGRHGSVLFCSVLYRKASAKETRKGYIQWWGVWAQVLKVRDSLHVALRTRNRPDGGSITDCSYQTRIFS